MGYKIAIDGPAATGKGTVTKQVAKELNILNIDSGMIYRAFAVYVKRNGVDINSIDEIKNAIQNVNIRLELSIGGAKVYLDNEDISDIIREEEISALTPKVAKIKEVREYVVNMQRALANNHNVIMEGRDIGSVVFPDAELKIFLTADVDARAKRRYDELASKGKNVTFEDVRTQIIARDKEDSTREVSPLTKTDDMIEIDTTDLTITEVIERVKELIVKKGLGCF